MIIGISGFARSGKDTLADILTSQHCYIKVSFADKMREALLALNPFVLHDSNGTSISIVDAVNAYGWDGIKSSSYAKDSRRLLQRFGTEAGRRVIGENIWVDATMNSIDPNKDYVISDMRFLNELEAVKARGGLAIRVNRKGVGPANSHTSETEMVKHLDIMDHTIDNDESFGRIAVQVRKIIEHEGILQ